MSAVLDGQLDLLSLLEPEPAPHIDLSGLTGFTMSVTDPDELDRLRGAWQIAHNATFGSGKWRMFPGWWDKRTAVSGTSGPHPSFGYTADLRCKHSASHGPRMVIEALADPCQCVGNDYYHRIYCAGCDWWTDVHDGENEAAEDYLDHCWPGWRDLPPVETAMKPSGGYDFKIPDDYPEAWQIPGAPLRDCRGDTSIGTRHVPSGSPWGGYKAAVIRPCAKHDSNYPKDTK